jgi:hypothetical protein
MDVIALVDPVTSHGLPACSAITFWSLSARSLISSASAGRSLLFLSVAMPPRISKACARAGRIVWPSTRMSIGRCQDGHRPLQRHP